MKKILTLATGFAIVLSGMVPLLASAQVVEGSAPSEGDTTVPMPPRSGDGKLKDIQMYRTLNMDEGKKEDLKKGMEAVSLDLLHAREAERKANAARLASSSEPRTKAFDDVVPVKVVDKMIDNRLELLKKLSDRITEAKHLTPEQKSAILLSLTGTTNNLLEIKSGVSSTTDKAGAKAAAEEVRTANRVYALVHPQTAIQAAGDRILTIVTQMETLSAKLSTRISEMSAAGKDTTAESAAFTDFTAQIGTAKTAAHAALDGVSGLTADNGDDTVAASNKAALKEARAQLEKAQKALKAARKDIGIIYEKTKGHDEGRKSASSTVESKGSSN